MDFMVSIRWCKGQIKGIAFVEPNDNLTNEYIATAKETLDVLHSITGKSNVWLATTKYYAEYFAFYALLMKIGVKCEIHDCTIAIAHLLEKENILPKGFAKVLEDDKQLRIDNQYYLKNREVVINYDDLLKFVLTVQKITLGLTQTKIENIRKILKRI